MLWTIAFMVTLVIGGPTGVPLAVPPVDRVVERHPEQFADLHLRTTQRLVKA